MSSQENGINSLKEELIDAIQSANLNFLIGSGLSSPYLGLLGNIENLISQLEEREDIKKIQKNIIKAYLYKKYFDDVIKKNKDVFKKDSLTDEQSLLSKTIFGYKRFLGAINLLLLKRKSTTLHRQVNLFTTNIDILIEKALEHSSLDFNSGFSGEFNPQFNTGNFKKIYSKQSSHYENLSEIPIFNLFKIHGSLSWKKENGNDGKKIILDRDLCNIKNIEKEIKKDSSFIELLFLNIEDSDNNIDDLLKKTKKYLKEYSFDNFIKIFEEIPIVLPAKRKFKETLINNNYYDILRIYSNDLEKENTILFVMGFSFSDEHIREITRRVANSNPTLSIYIFAHSDDGEKELKIKFKNSKYNNIKYIPRESDKKFDLNTIADFLKTYQKKQPVRRKKRKKRNNGYRN